MDTSGHEKDASIEDMMVKLKQTFKPEAYELVAELETALLELEKSPQDQEVIGRVFRAMHTIKGSGAACGLGNISEFAHEFETFFDLVRNGKASVSREIIDLTLAALDYIKLLLDECYCGRGFSDPQHGKHIIAAFKQLYQEHKNSAEACLFRERSGLGSLNLDAGPRAGEDDTESTETMETSLAEQQQFREARLKKEETTSIRVSTEKLDRLVDLVGELVTIQARFSQTARAHKIPEFKFLAEQVKRVSDEIHDRAMDIRMLPIGTIFGKFGRIVRDLSQELGKEIDLVTEGASTEIDKTVMERLSDPLIHIIRNCIDHGIEFPRTREAVGKPRHGTLRLSGSHSGAYVMIKVSDDGIGLDRDAIRATAVEKGLLQPGSALTDRELCSLIFKPGFSTTNTVTDVSGRGVGLDVVKKTIEALRGSIDITSARGEGTTLTLKLPLTLAIIEGLLAKIHDQYYVLPMSFVQECVELTAEDKRRFNDRQIADVRGEIVPYINLRKQFFVPGEPPLIEQIVITETEGVRVGFVVDKVVGEHQTVIKSLGAFYRRVDGVYGSTIMGDGTVALILDIPKLTQIAELEEKGAFAHN